MLGLSKIKSRLLITWFAAALGVNLALLPSPSQPVLKVVLSPASPAGIAIPGTRQEVIRFDLIATGADFTVKHIKFSKKGLCSAMGTGEAYLADRQDLMVPLATLRAGTAWFAQDSIIFNKFPQPLVIAANTTKTISFMGDTTGCRDAVTFSIPKNGILAQYLASKNKKWSFGRNLTPVSVNVGGITGGRLLFSSQRQPGPEVSLRAILAAASPSGAGVPGLSEVLRFILAPSGDKDVEIKELNFKPATTCQNFLSPTASLYESIDLTTSLKNWTWTNQSEFLNGFSAQGLSKTIVAGTSKTFTLKFDTIGCSARNDEMFRMDLTGGSWLPSGPGGVLSTTIQNTPLNGGTIVY